MTDTKLEQLYSNFLEFTDHMVGQYDPMAVAGVMMAQAMSIYKTSMDEQEYNMMVDSISANRDKVKKFTNTVLQ
jgi:hypothetical protein